MEEKETESENDSIVEYEVVKDADLKKYLAYDVVEGEGDSEFWYDDEDELVGTVVNFELYPPFEALTEAFEDALIEAVMETQEIDEDDAKEEIDDIESEEDLPDLGINETFSLFFTVNNHRGMYRVMLDCNEHWVCHSNGTRKSRWEF